MINVSTFAGCFALRLRSTAAAFCVSRPATTVLELRTLQVPPASADKDPTCIPSSPMFTLVFVLLAVCSLLACAAPCAAQGFGIGAPHGHGSRPIGDDELDPDAVRFIGGHIRLSRRTRSASKSHWIATPRPSSFSTRRSPKHPSRRRSCSSGSRAAVSALPARRPGLVQPQANRPHRWPGGRVDLSTHEFGWHAGGGLEVAARQARRAPRRLPLHLPRLRRRRRRSADRHPAAGSSAGLLPGHKGSMWTVGATLSIF